MPLDNHADIYFGDYYDYRFVRTEARQYVNFSDEYLEDITQGSYKGTKKPIKIEFDNGILTLQINNPTSKNVKTYISKYLSNDSLIEGIGANPDIYTKILKTQ